MSGNLSGGRRGPGFSGRIFFVVLGCLLCWWLLLPLPASAAPAAKGRPAPLVVVDVVKEQDVVPAREYVGHLEAIQQVDLRARVEGFLEEVRFREGANVKAGELLYVIEPTLYEAKVAEARANIDQARAELERAGRHLQRLRAASPESIRATDMDSAVAAELAAKARLAAAEASLTLAQLNLDYTRVRAPISGRIGRNAYTRGNLVNPASGPLNRIVQLDPIWVLYSVSENDVGAIIAAMKDSRQPASRRLLRPQLRLGDGT
ncbi:MAG: efflux RND transporter periplasmic adaptor subunit, partial [Deltaproteobacteria bacterium]|nr:efflux RND transporter periplasmic adaptor subunit [Deltaproteobacteria bacterium]